MSYLKLSQSDPISFTLFYRAMAAALQYPPQTRSLLEAVEDVRRSQKTSRQSTVSSSPKVEIENASQRTFSCPVEDCDCTFSRNHNMKVHLQVKHAELDPLVKYPSFLCIFPLHYIRENLVSCFFSMPNISFRIRSFPFLPYYSSYAQYFQRRRSNFNNKIYECMHESCSKKYSLKNNMMQHFRKVWITTAFKLFFCSSIIGTRWKKTIVHGFPDLISLFKWGKFVVFLFKLDPFNRRCSCHEPSSHWRDWKFDDYLLPWSSVSIEPDGPGLNSLPIQPLRSSIHLPATWPSAS